MHLRLFFLLTALESLACVIFLTSMPADPKNVILLGYSARRLAVIGMVILMLFVSGALAWISRCPEKTNRWVDWLQMRSKWLRIALLSATILFLGGWVLTLTPAYRFRPYNLIYKGLLPVITLVTVISLQTALWLLAIGFGFDRAKLKAGLHEVRSLVRTAAIIFAILLLGWGMVAISGLGLTPDIAFWNMPGVPLLSPLAMLGWAAGMSLLILARALPSHPAEDPSRVEPSAIQIVQDWGGSARRWRADIAICLVIFILSAGVWLAQPIVPTFFAPGPSLPNNIIYPYSDASVYDMAAQFALIGQKMMDGNPVDKPIYSTFLFLLHLLAGQDYTRLTALQIIAFAIIPVLVFLIAKAISDRVTGVVAALLVSFKIATAIVAAGLIAYPNPRLLLSELPTAIGLLFFTLWVFHWWKKPESGWVYLTLAGGTVGLLTLVRHNTWILLPLMLIIITWLWRRNIRLAAFSSLLFTAALTISILPWMVRSYQENGSPWYFIGSLRSVVWNNRYELKEDALLFPGNPAFPDEIFTARISEAGATSGKTGQVLAASETCGDIDDLEPLPPETYDDTEAGILFCGDWQVIQHNKAYQSTAHLSETPGDSVYLKFTGNQITILYAAFEDGGSLDIAVDGETIHQLNMRQSDGSDWRVMWTSPALDRWGNKEHFLVLTTRDGGRTALDAILIQRTPFASFVADTASKLAEAAVFVPSHFCHNLVTNLLMLPTTLQNDDMDHLVSGENSYWLNNGWAGRLTFSQALLLFVDIALFALGLAYTWNRWRLMGWLPLLVFLVYNLGTALARTSGGRYIAPTDWVVLLYYAAGLVQVTYWAAVPFGFRMNQPEKAGEKPSNISKSRKQLFSKEIGKITASLLFLLLVGSLPLAIENILPQTYPDYSPAEQIQMLEKQDIASALGVSSAELNAFMTQPDAVVQSGRALYPRFNFVDKGEPSTKGIYSVMGYPRLSFILIGPDGLTAAVLPAAGEEAYPRDFPHASDVTLLGCDNGEFIEVIAVVLKQAETKVYLRSPFAPLQCPLPEPVCEDDSHCQ